MRLVPLNVLLAAALMLATTDSVRATSILARCGPSTGQSYYFEAGIVGPGQGGWKKDGFDNGRITAFINKEDKLDIIMKDGTGVRSYLKEGYDVSLINFSKQDAAFLISAQGSNFSETYLFKINQLGVGTLSWTASKVTPLVIRTTVMTAECGPNFAIEP